MSGLREKKKQKSRELIMETARILFLEKGYSNTSMQEIAENAEVGVGTLYNYFNSKAEILIAFLASNVSIILGQGTIILANIEHDPIEAIIRLLINYTQLFLPLPKPLWREFLAAAYSDTDALGGKLRGVQVQFITQLKELFLKLQAQELLRKEINLDEAAHALYGIFFMQYLRFINSDLTLEELNQSLHVQVQLVYQGLRS
jgi:AcrR family transcriptional regulator